VEIFSPKKVYGLTAAEASGTEMREAGLGRK
jgi:hypothetical protein